MMICENDIDFTDKQHEAVSLQELNLLVHDAIKDAFPETYWVRAETSDVRVNAASGHCYLEFIEKDEISGQMLAKARGMIWSRIFTMLKPYFEDATERPFASGLKVLVNVSVEFHELYGFSLTVHDIDPSYTIGDMVKKRMEIVRRLQEEGIFDLNRELTFPDLPQRVAVITSPTAAGYGDFVDQLENNEYGFPFYLKLFPALMQGEKTEESVIAALDKIYLHKELFDAVVIIRGGGSTADLSSFDSYGLAANCAQFPLPIISGIGHERDESIVDMVAHTRMKTPTAVAAFLIDKMIEQASMLNEIQKTIYDGATDLFSDERMKLQSLIARLTFVPQLIKSRNERLSVMSVSIRKAAEAMLSERKHEIELNEHRIRLLSPEFILKRGYALIYKDDKIVKRTSGLAAGDEVKVRFTDGDTKLKVISDK